MLGDATRVVSHPVLNFENSSTFPSQKYPVTLSRIKLNFAPIFSTDDVYDEEEDMNCTKDEDELERAELRRLQRQMDDQTAESQEERDYKEEFFELLDEVNLAHNTNGALSTEIDQTSIK